MNLKQIFATARREYSLKPFTEKEALNNPVKLFDLWIRQAAKSGVWDANAMTLSTLDSKGYPTSRIVLLKGFDKNGFTFFTNYRSYKGNQIKSRSKVGLLFFWPECFERH